MSVAVLIPWRTTQSVERHRALAYVISRHAANRWPVIIGRHDNGAWCKAAAVADALEQTPAEVLVIADADVWTDGLHDAARWVRDGAAWAVPFRGVYRLTEASTVRYAQREPLVGLATEEPVYTGFEGGGMTVIRRDVYEDCPLDPRFVGWGGEDDSHGFALRTLHGPPLRPTSVPPLVHFWHAPQERATRSFGSLAGRDLRKRYARAQGNPQAMRALIEEAKAHDPHATTQPAGHDHPTVRVGND